MPPLAPGEQEGLDRREQTVDLVWTLPGPDGSSHAVFEVTVHEAGCNRVDIGLEHRGLDKRGVTAASLVDLPGQPLCCRNQPVDLGAKL